MKNFKRKKIDKSYSWTRGSGWLDKIFKTMRPLAELFNLPNIAIAFLRQYQDGEDESTIIVKAELSSSANRARTTLNAPHIGK